MSIGDQTNSKGQLDLFVSVADYRQFQLFINNSPQTVCPASLNEAHLRAAFMDFKTSQSHLCIYLYWKLYWVGYIIP